MIIYIVLLISFIIINFYKTKRSLHMLQQNLYNENNRYLKWIKKNFKKAFSIFDLVPIIIFAVIIFVKDKETIDLNYFLKKYNFIEKEINLICFGNIYHINL